MDYKLLFFSNMANINLTFLYSLMCLLCVNSRTLTSRIETSIPIGCEWENRPSKDENNNDVKMVLNCNVRTIGNADVLLWNLTSYNIERITSLQLTCSDMLFFESTLESSGRFLNALHRLKDLNIEYCKIRYVPSMVLTALRDLKSFTLRTHNTDWSAMAMEFHSESFRGLMELRHLDLGENNIWSLPTEVFCPLYSLQVLNLTRNRIQDVALLSFSDWGNGPSNPGKSCNTGLEILDLSSNDINSLTDNGLSSLRSLQALYLQENVLTSLADRSFVGLTSLQVLNMSSNLLVALPPELFQSSRDLAQLYLQNNTLSVLAPGLLEGLDHLQVLDLSRNELTSSWVNRDTFSGLVRLVVLNLSYNNINRIDNHVFHDLYSLQILSLEHNGIEIIAENAFSDLNNLHALTLSQNKLTHVGMYHFSGLYVLNQLFLDSNKIQVINNRSFENMTNLHDLGLNDNLLQNIPEGIGKLHYLKSLDLGKNQIKSVNNASFDGLEQLYGLRLVDNLITNISRDSFMTLPSLQVLNLASNKIRHVDQSAFGSNPTIRAIRLDGNHLEDISGVFTNLPSLVWLNVSDNKLRWFDYSHLPPTLEWLDMHLNNISELGNYFSVRNNLRIKMLDASYNKLTHIIENAIPDSMEVLFLNNNNISVVDAGAFLNKTNLEKVVLYANSLRKMELASLGLSPGPEYKPVPQFYLSDNPFYCDCTMEWLQKINQLSSSRHYPRVMDLDTVTCELPHSRNDKIKPLMDVKSNQFLCPYDTHCFALCHCCDFFACDCQMQCPDRCACYHDHAWSANVVDCSRANYTEVPDKIPMDATEIYLDGNNFGQLESHVFIGKKKLQVLYLNNSNINAVHNKTFNGVKSLQILHMENNYLSELRGFEFDQLNNLKELYLDNNAITKVGNNTFKNMKSFEIISLNDNDIVDFHPWKLFGNAVEISKVTLEGNKWSCDCVYILQLETFLANTDTNMDNMICNNSNNETVSMKLRTCKSDFEVNTPIVQRTVLPTNGIFGAGYIPLLAAILVAIIGASLLVALVFVFRQDVRLWAHAKYGVRLFKDTEGHIGNEEDRERLYDGYIVYSARDDDFTSKILASELEQYGQCLCLHHRDILGGSYLTETLLSASEASKRLVIVLSNNFLQNEWSLPEFRVAMQATLENIRPSVRKHKIVLIVLIKFEILAMDPILQILLRTCTVINWGEKHFWEKLHYSMPDVPGVKNVVRSSNVKKVQEHKKSPNLRYTAAPTSLDRWYKLHNNSAIPASVHISTPTPSQSSYIHESRTEDEGASSCSTTNTNSQHYSISNFDLPHGYTSIDGRDRSLRDSTASMGHVYSTIPETPGAPSGGKGRTYYV